MITIRVSKQLQFSGGKETLSVDVVVKENSITALYGESGSGKTTLLKIIAGLIKPEAGFVSINDVVWLDTAKRINLSTQQRSIGFVFQDYALFPNMTMLQNLRYAAGKHPDESFINRLAEIVSLQPFLHAKPAQLSGGQQQRVALIRALVRKPKLLLLDEPLSALDVSLKHSLHQVLQQLQKELSFTAILVSHDIGEVYTLAHEVIQLQEGKVVFTGTPQQLFGSGSLSSKVQLMGEVLTITQNDVIYIVEVLAGLSVIKLTASQNEISDLKIGDKVLIYAKAFHVGMKKML